MTFTFWVVRRANSVCYHTYYYKFRVTILPIWLYYYVPTWKYTIISYFPDPSSKYYPRAWWTQNNDCDSHDHIFISVIVFRCYIHGKTTCDWYCRHLYLYVLNPRANARYLKLLIAYIIIINYITPGEVIFLNNCCILLVRY